MHQLDLCHEFSEQELAADWFDSDWLAGYLARHFTDDRVPERSFRYTAELLNRVEDELAGQTIRHPDFRQAAWALVDEHHHLPRRDVPIEVDTVLRFARSASPSVRTRLDAFVDVAWERHPDQAVPAHLGELLFLAAHNPPDPDEQYRQRLAAGLRRFFAELTENQLNRIFSDDNAASLACVQELRDDLQSAGGLPALLRLYFLSPALFRERRTQLAGLLRATDPDTAPDVRSANLIRALQTEHPLEETPPVLAQRHPLRSWMRRRPHLALCVSGQLRGYQQAHASWQQALQLSDVHVSTFVSVWRDVGAKGLTASHLDRHFPPTLSAVVERRWVEMGEQRFRSLFPHLCSAVAGTQAIDEQTLRTTYRTDHVLVHEDDALPGVSNSVRMHYQIEQAWQLAQDSGQPFDLVLRIRPDKLLQAQPVPWRELARSCRRERVCYADFAPRVRPHQGIAIGDQVNLAGPELARVMHRPHTLVNAAAEQGGYFGLPDFRAHGTLGGLALVHDIEVRALALPGSRLCNPRTLDAGQIAAALAADRGPETSDDVDLFLAALDQH